MHIALSQAPMSFTETKVPFGPYTKVSVRHEETGNEFTIIPEVGACLNHFQVNLHGDSVDIIDGYSDAHSLAEGSKIRGVLNLPSFNEVENDIASNRAFIIESSGQVDDYYELVLREEVGEEMKHKDTSVVVRYRFGGPWLEVDTELINISKRHLPAGFFWNPHFRTTDTIARLRLTLPEVEQVVPTGKSEKFDEFAAAHPIVYTELAAQFRMLGESKEAQLFDEMLGLYITMTFPETDSPYEYLRVTTPEHRRSIAIEPATCITDSAGEGVGIRKLAPNEALRSHFTIVVS